MKLTIDVHSEKDVDDGITALKALRSLFAQTTEAEPVAEPPPRKSRKRVATRAAAVSEETTPELDEPIGDQPIEEVRARLLAMARARGIDWARLVLSANGVAKFSELSDADVMSIVRDHDTADDAA